MTNFITHPFAKMNNRSIVKNHENPQTLGKFQDPSPPPPPPSPSSTPLPCGLHSCKAPK